jgi:hypothetical protein
LTDEILGAMSLWARYAMTNDSWVYKMGWPSIVYTTSPFFKSLLKISHSYWQTLQEAYWITQLCGRSMHLR